MGHTYDDAIEPRRYAWVAQALGISVETLDGYPFDLDDNAGNDGPPHGWCILWNGDAPPGVNTSGMPGLLWSDIPAAPDEPNRDDADA